MLKGLSLEIKKILMEKNPNFFWADAKKPIGIMSVDFFTRESVYEGFKNFLEAQQLSERTVKVYLSYHNYMILFLDEAGVPLNQEVVNVFVNKYNCFPGRAYVRQLLRYLKNKEIDIPKITGRRARKKPHIISDREIEEVATFLYKWKLKYGLMFDLTLACALRRHEIIGIRLDDFDWESWKTDKTRPCRLKIRGKGNKERWVIVPSILMKGIIVYLNQVPQEDEKPLFQIKKSGWHEVWHHACLRALGKSYKLHEIRHTRATKWYQEGKDIMQIKNRLGHASVSTTELYINPDEEETLAQWESEVS